MSEKLKAFIMSVPPESREVLHTLQNPLLSAQDSLFSVEYNALSAQACQEHAMRVGSAECFVLSKTTKGSGVGRGGGSFSGQRGISVVLGESAHLPGHTVMEVSIARADKNRYGMGYGAQRQDDAHIRIILNAQGIPVQCSYKKQEAWCDYDISVGYDGQGRSVSYSYNQTSNLHSSGLAQAQKYTVSHVVGQQHFHADPSTFSDAPPPEFAQDCSYILRALSGSAAMLSSEDTILDGATNLEGRPFEDRKIIEFASIRQGPVQALAYYASTQTPMQCLLDGICHVIALIETTQER